MGMMKLLLLILMQRASRTVPETTMIHYSNQSRKQIHVKDWREGYAINSVTSKLGNYINWILLSMPSLSNFNLKPQIRQLIQKTWYQAKDMILTIVAQNCLCSKAHLTEIVLLGKEIAGESTRVENPEKGESIKMDYRAPWILQEQFQFQRMKEIVLCKIDPNYIWNLWFYTLRK